MSSSSFWDGPYFFKSCPLIPYFSNELGNILENLHVTSPTGSLARSIAQHQEEMKLLSLESMKKNVKHPQTSNQISSQSNPMNQSDILNSKDGTPELQIV